MRLYIEDKEFLQEIEKSMRMREIIAAGVEQAAWLPLSKEFFSGDEIGFDFAGVNVWAKILFDIGKLTVEMNSPVNCTASKVVYGHRSFFNRTGAFRPFCEDGKEGGPATAYCVETAKELLVNLFSDWFILNLRREEIHQKMATFEEFSRIYIAREKARVLPIKQTFHELSQQSADAKRQLKAGLISQSEYIRIREPLHEKLSELTRQMRIKDPFEIRFEAELRDCHYAENARALIRSI
jgi:hypothetical protein